MIGHIKVHLPVYYTQPYHKFLAEWTRHDLWKALVTTDGAIASIIVNNTLLITVTGSYLIIDSAVGRMKQDIVRAVPKVQFNPSIPIGYVRTCPEVKDVNVPPYVLYMDNAKRVSLHGAPPMSLEDAIPCTDKSLYKTLITCNKSAIYATRDGIKFLD